LVTNAHQCRVTASVPPFPHPRGRSVAGVPRWLAGWQIPTLFSDHVVLGPRSRTHQEGESMSRPLPSAVEQRWQEVLRRADVALQRPGVGVWEADPRGQVRLLAASDPKSLAPILDQVPAILWTTDRELHVISRAGAGLKSQQILPERIAGASLLEQQSQQKVSAESVAAHRRALAGESVSYQIRLLPRCYDA